MMLVVSKSVVLHSGVFVVTQHIPEAANHQTAVISKSTPVHSLIHHKNCNTMMMHLPLLERKKKTDSINY